MFLENVFRFCNKGFINLRFLPSGRDFFIPLPKIDSIPGILENNPGEAPYFSVATKQNGDTTKDGILQVPALWCEVKVDCFKNLRLKPSFVVAADVSFWFYWLLKNPAPQDKIPMVENLLNRVVLHFKGKPEAADINYFLPLPEPCTLKEYNPKRLYVLEESKSPPQLHTITPYEGPSITEDTHEADKEHLPVLNEVVSILQNEARALGVWELLHEVRKKKKLEGIGQNKFREILHEFDGKKLLSKRIARGKLVY